MIPIVFKTKRQKGFLNYYYLPEILKAKSITD